MNHRERNSLVKIFTRQTGWPEPEKSAGDLIKTIGGKRSCWKAEGPAREAFKTLAEEIKAHLESCMKSIRGRAW